MTSHKIILAALTMTVERTILPTTAADQAGKDLHLAPGGVPFAKHPPILLCSKLGILTTQPEKTETQLLAAVQALTLGMERDGEGHGPRHTQHLLISANEVRDIDNDRPQHGSSSREWFLILCSVRQCTATVGEYHHVAA